MRVLVFLLAAALAEGAVLSTAESKMLASIDAERDRTIQLTEAMVNVNSGTMNFAGVRAVGQTMQSELEPLGFHTRWVPLDEVHRAGYVVAEHPGTSGKRMLLICHLDTVFEKNSPFQKFVRTGDMAVGPGSEDTKGGLAVMVAALRAMKAAQVLDTARITIVLTGDEENPGEPVSIARKEMMEIGRASDVALEFEPGIRVNGKDTGSTSRRGASSWMVKTTGISGHSSQIWTPAMGYGAVNELIRILDAFAKELPEPFLTFNTGLMVGGSAAKLNEAVTGGEAFGKLNVIAGEAFAVGDLRTLQEGQLERAHEKMRAIVAKHLPKTDAEVTFRELMPPMPPDRNRGLLRAMNTINEDLGVSTVEELDPMQRGGGDISFVAKDLECLTGLGSVGSGAHAPGESVDLTSLALQAKRAALLMYRLSQVSSK